jgi:glycosyltransferase involved in cell wall biosynthesis
MESSRGPRVDVVIPSYNYARFLEDCIGSALQQEGVDLRVIVLDNASTDDSVAIARRIAAADPRVSLVARPQNIGLHRSLNDGIDRLTGDFAVFLCADDMLAPGALARAGSFLTANPSVALAFGRGELFSTEPPALRADQTNGTWKIQSGTHFIRRCCRFARMPFLMSSVLVRTEPLRKAGTFRSEIFHTSDFELWLRVALHGDVAETTAVQGLTRIHGGNLQLEVRSAHDWNLELEGMFDSFFQREGKTLPRADELARLARRSLGERAYWSAMAHAARGQFTVARDLAVYAARRAPWSLVLPPVTMGIGRFAAVRRLAASLGWDLRHT